MTPRKGYAIVPGSSSFESEDCECDDRELLNHQHTLNRTYEQKRRHWTFLAVNTFVLVLNVALVLIISISRPNREFNDAKALRWPHLPHHDWIAPAIELEARRVDDKFGIHGVFRGTPRPELDEAWSKPVANYTIRIPKPGWQNPTAPGRILAEWQDEEGGIAGTFSFLHNLHCLKTIREYLLPEYYPKTFAMYPSTPEEPLHLHIDHCIDMLRQSELCHADLALTAYEWAEGEPKPVNIHKSPHVCKNIDKVNEFLAEHTVPPFGPILVNPFTGKIPFPLE